MFEFTSNIPVQIDYANIVKVQSEIRNLEDLTPTLNRIYGSAPVPNDLDTVMVSRSYQNRTGVPLVMRGSKALKIGGSKEKFEQFSVEPFIMTDSYTQTQLNQYEAMFKNKPVEYSVSRIQSKFIEMAMKKAYITLNGSAILGTIGGDVSIPTIDGNGQETVTTLNFGKVHGASATDSTLASFTGITNITTSSKLVEFLKNVSKMTTAMKKNGVSLDGASFLLGETLYWTVAGLVDTVSPNDAIAKNIKIGDQGDDYFTLNGRKFELATDSFTDPLTNAVTKLVEDKELKIIGKQSYHLWAYLKPDEPECTAPQLYFGKEWYENNPAGRTMLFNMRHICVPDTNAISKATMMA